MFSIFKQKILRWLLQFQQKPWMWSPSYKATRRLPYLSTVAFKNPSCGSGNILLLTAETIGFAYLCHVSPSDRPQLITNFSLAMTSRAKAVFNFSLVQDFVNNSSVYFRVNSKGEQKKTREQKKIKWGGKGYKGLGAERMKGWETMGNHAFRGKSEVEGREKKLYSKRYIYCCKWKPNFSCWM